MSARHDLDGPSSQHEGFDHVSPHGPCNDRTSPGPQHPHADDEPIGQQVREDRLDTTVIA